MALDLVQIRLTQSGDGSETCQRWCFKAGVRDTELLPVLEAVRVFTLGIGKRVSHELVEGITKQKEASLKSWPLQVAEAGKAE